MPRRAFILGKMVIVFIIMGVRSPIAMPKRKKAMISFKITELKSG